jgi:tetratricopeptide (TPR) repeat protein
VTVDYPADGSIVPPDLAAPTFLWHDAAPDADRWLLEVSFGEASPGKSSRGEGRQRLSLLVPGDPPPKGEIDPRAVAENNEIYEGTPYQASARSWKPGPEVWEAIKRHSVERPARLTFLGYRSGRPDRPLSRGQLRLTTSRDPVGAPIFYRDVPLMPSQTEEGVIKPLAKGALPLIAWRLKDVSRADSRVLLTDMPTCANCHSFSSDGRTLGLDIDGPQGDKGAYALVTVAKRTLIRDEDVMTWNAYPGMKTGLNTLGFLSRVSPDGQWVVSTINEALYVRNFWTYKFNQVFYPTRGILAAYSRRTREIRALPGADDPAYVHCDPVWTPDGKTIVFARARAGDAYIAGRPDATYAGDPNETPIQYDLHRMPFNEGRGGKPEPIAGASRNGMSNAFPKVSPDGKWVVFVRCRNGQLMRPDGRLFVVPIGGGEAREMRCNLSLMNSWHSFSPNGRWMVFSSKSNTPYTQMFLTHFDEDGSDSPAILIENATAANRAVNIPEFVNVPYDEFQSIEVPAVEPARHFNRGTELATAGRHEEAVAEYRKALEGPLSDWRTNSWRVRGNLSKSLLVLGRREEALDQVREALRLNPYSGEMHANLGYILFAGGDLARALEHTNQALRLAPKDPRPWSNRATIRLRQGDVEGALGDYGEAVRRDPKFADAYIGRGTILRDRGDLAGALADFTSAVEAAPGLPAPLYNRAHVRLRTGDRAGALDDLTQALRVAPADWAHRAEAEALRRQVKDRAAQ